MSLRGQQDCCLQKSRERERHGTVGVGWAYRPGMVRGPSLDVLRALLQAGSTTDQLEEAPFAGLRLFHLTLG